MFEALYETDTTLQTQSLAPPPSPPPSRKPRKKPKPQSPKLPSFECLYAQDVYLNNDPQTVVPREYPFLSSSGEWRGNKPPKSYTRNLNPVVVHILHFVFFRLQVAWLDPPVGPWGFGNSRLGLLFYRHGWQRRARVRRLRARLATWSSYSASNSAQTTSDASRPKHRCIE